MLTCSVQYASVAGGSPDLQNISVDRFGGSWNWSLAASDAQQPGGAYYMIYRVYFQHAYEYVIDLESSAFDTYLQVAEVGTLNIMAENDDDGGSTNLAPPLQCVRQRYLRPDHHVIRFHAD